MTRKKLWPWIVGGLLASLMIIAAFAIIQRVGRPQSPAEVAQAYFLTNYTQDYPAAWRFISRGDKAAKIRQQYLAENPPATPLQAGLLQQLAVRGNFTVFATAWPRPEQALVSAELNYPDRTQPALISLLEAAGQPEADGPALREQLQNLYQAGQIQWVKENVTFNLTRDPDGWRIVLHWDNAIAVRLTAAVSPDLPWEFYPLESEIQVMPGETRRVNYFARNISDRTITGKAVHEILPLEYRSYFETVQCFCFTEQTLGPGEAREMPLVLRIDFAVPQGVAEFSNGYTFYTLESFPEMQGGQ